MEQNPGTAFLSNLSWVTAIGMQRNSMVNMSDSDFSIFMYSSPPYFTIKQTLWDEIPQ